MKITLFGFSLGSIQKDIIFVIEEHNIQRGHNIIISMTCTNTNSLGCTKSCK